MRSLRLALPAAVFALVFVVADSAAQSRVIVESRRPYPSAYSRRPVRVVARPRVIVVERLVVDRRHRNRDAGWVRRQGFRPVTLYYVDGRYYDRWFDRRGIREVVVFTRGGRYYRDHDQNTRYDRYDRNDSRYDARYDSRYDERYDQRYDDRTDREREHDERLKDREEDRYRDDDKYDRN